MKQARIIGRDLSNIPWQEKPEGNTGVLWRHQGNPITDWNITDEMSRVYNSAVVPFGTEFRGIFRADHRDGKARLHAGTSKDALRWNFDPKPIQWFDESGQPFQPFYAYDPRVVELDGTYYIIWCTEFGGGPSLGLGSTTDFVHFVRHENICVPCNRNGVLFPRKIGGNYLLLNRPSDSGHTPFGDIFLSESPDLKYWGKHRKVMSRGGSGWWQGLKIGAGPIPIETTAGWLLFYHGVNNTCNGFVYSIGAAILDIDNPAKVLYRTRDYLLTPEKAYETVGFVQNVAFPCAALSDASTGRIALYYGAADTYTSVAYCQVNELVDYIVSHSELVPGDERDWR